MKKVFTILASVLFLSCHSYSFESIPAKWHHDLSSTSLVGYKKGEHLIVSSIYTGTYGKDAVIKHSVEVKVSSFGKPYSSTFESKEGKSKETLTVTLYELSNQKEMKADFEHLVYENGTVILKFCGTTVLVRVG